MNLIPAELSSPSHRIPAFKFFLAINKFSAKVFLGCADKSYINGATVGAQSGA